MDQSPSQQTPDRLAQLAQDWRVKKLEYPGNRYEGRGIVIAAGGTTTFTNAYVLISVLRRTLHCALPIEVWHFGAGEMSAAMASLLTEFDVELVNAVPRIAEAKANVRDGWQLKPFAILNSRFEEVLFLDADQVPVRDPATVFGWPEYTETGAVFWPDIVALRADNPVWARFGLPAQRKVSFESGQILVDKRRHWTALNATLNLNEHADELYQLIYGDKDSFLLAWALLEANFALVPHQPLGDDRCLVQRDFSGAPIFQHRCNAKWRYAGDQEIVQGFVHFDDCLAAVERLRRDWNGRIFNAPDRSARARHAEAALIAAGTLTLEVIGDERTQLALHAFGEIGQGRSFDRQNWWCEEVEGHIELVLRDADRQTYRLRAAGEDSWVGNRMRPPNAPVVINGSAPGKQASPAAGPGLVDALLGAVGFPHQSTSDDHLLVAALTMLARVEPDVTTRLEELAASQPELAEALSPLIARLPAQVDIRPVVRGMGVIEQRYQPVSGKDDG